MNNNKNLANKIISKAHYIAHEWLSDTPQVFTANKCGRVLCWMWGFINNKPDVIYSNIPFKFPWVPKTARHHTTVRHSILDTTLHVFVCQTPDGPPVSGRHFMSPPVSGRHFMSHGSYVKMSTQGKLEIMTLTNKTTYARTEHEQDITTW